jgi:hypothetical protein
MRNPTQDAASARPEIPMPSNRSTGFVFAGVAAAVAWFWRDNLTVVTLALGAAEILIVLAISFPRLLSPLNVAWFRLGLLLHKIMNPIVMLALFAVAIVPAGLIMQRLRDPLRLKRPKDASYWIKSDTKENTTQLSMTQQF